MKYIVLSVLSVLLIATVVHADVWVIGWCRTVDWSANQSVFNKALAEYQGKATSFRSCRPNTNFVDVSTVASNGISAFCFNYTSQMMKGPTLITQKKCDIIRGNTSRTNSANLVVYSGNPMDLLNANKIYSVDSKGR